MQSDFSRLLFAPQFLIACAVILCSGCQQSSELTVLVDNPSSAGMEIILVPSDPATLLPADAPSLSNAQADSLRLLKTLDDSSQSLIDQFSKLREELNAEANSLSALDRRSKQYAQRYDEFRPRFAQAETLRASRDKIRARAGSLRAALSRLLPDSARVQRAARESRQRIESVRTTAGTTKIIAVSGTATNVALGNGSWWIGVAHAGLLPRRFVKVDVGAGSRDTVRLKA